jgi:hypothetical protein
MKRNKTKTANSNSTHDYTILQSTTDERTLLNKALWYKPPFKSRNWLEKLVTRAEAPMSHANKIEQKYSSNT